MHPPSTRRTKILWILMPIQLNCYNVFDAEFISKHLWCKSLLSKVSHHPKYLSFHFWNTFIELEHIHLQFTQLKCTVQWFLVYLQMWVTITTVKFYHPKGNSVPFGYHSLSPYLPYHLNQSLGSSNLYFLQFSDSEFIGSTPPTQLLFKNVDEW